MKYTLLLILILTLLLSSCSETHKAPDVENIRVNFKLIPFYKDLSEISPDSMEHYLPTLKSKYGDYLKAISIKVLRIGSPDDKDYANNLKEFLKYDANRDVFRKIDSLYPNIEIFRPDIEQAFKYYKYYFPKNDCPDVYFHISGFNQSIVVDSTWLSVSIEKYLGSGCQFYKWLEIYNYIRRSMIPEKVVPDIMKAIALTGFPFQPDKYNLLNNLIYQGKVLYLVRQTCPSLPDTLLFDFTEKQLTWTENFEAGIWGYMIEQKHLFSTDRMVIQKYIGEGPFNSYLGEESPGKIGGYVGYKIVEKYMGKNPTITLQQLMKEQSGQKVLSDSGYSPG